MFVINDSIQNLGEVHCGNDTMAQSCNDCPKTNDTHPDDWCGGNCYYDEASKSCKEGTITNQITVI